MNEEEVRSCSNCIHNKVCESLGKFSEELYVGPFKSTTSDDDLWEFPSVFQALADVCKEYMKHEEA